MIQQLLDDIRSYLSAKTLLTIEETTLLERLKEDFFPITSVSRDDLQAAGFDIRTISGAQMRRLAKKMADDYCEQLFWRSMEIIADYMEFPRHPTCPICESTHIQLDLQSCTYCCPICGQIWHDKLYVLAEFPDNTSYFDENNIGYPSFESRDNGARYVPEYDYLEHFKKGPAPNIYFKPLRWPESQPYLFPDEPNESVDALCEPVWDEKGIADFGEQAVWVPVFNLINRKL